MAGLILVSNPGSSSKKYALFAEGKRLYSANLEENNLPQMHFREHFGSPASPEGGELRNKHLQSEGESATTTQVEYNQGLNWFIETSRAYHYLTTIQNLKAGVIRIVAPGNFFARHQVITPTFIAQLEQAAHYTPLHVLPALKEIQAFHAAAPHLPLVAASDSAFHRTLPPIARFYALDRTLSQNLDLERFGYHGLSVESVVSNLSIRKLLPRRVIVAHLGSGASLTAVFENQSIETTMGFSPLEGIPMTTRVGNIDAEAVLYLMRKTNLSVDELAELLTTQSGLRGMSGLSGDVRELLKFEEKGHPNASLALNLFCYRICQALGGLIASLGGLDLLVLTGAISERSPVMRNRIFTGLEYFNLKLDPQKNSILSNQIGLISDLDSIPILVHPTNEMGQMARIANQILG